MSKQISAVSKQNLLWLDMMSKQIINLIFNSAIFVNEGETPQPPILVRMSLNGSLLDLELHTGAEVTVMSQAQFQQLCPDLSLHPPSVKLKTYTGEIMKTAGSVDVEVAYQNQDPRTHSLVIVEGHGPALLGRNWLKIL
jgi:hypothetical protein